MNRRLFTVVLAVALGAGYALTAFSQVRPDVLVEQREAAMTLLGKYFGPLGGMVQGKVPYNADLVARNAGYLEVLSKMPWDGFQVSTAKEKSRALPAVYADAAKFKKAAEDMQAAVAKLVSVSKGGDEAATKAAIGEVGKACGGCHDNFRQRK
jgi:cytochrome c556